jgi:UDP-2,3-diacylglucosamine pyrophosphatase LpxH
MSGSAGNVGFVISDLHIFSYASLYERYLPMLEAAASTYKIVVLNGDTFDFKRSRYANNRETSHAAIEWLGSLCVRNPETTFYFLIGNHDCNYSFVDELTLLEKRCANLHVSHDVLQIGSSLFVHGDVCDLPRGSLDIDGLRARYSSQERSIGSILFAQVVTYLRLNVVEYIRHRNFDLASRILYYLKKKYPEKLSATERIFFGHTHVPFTDLMVDGIKFSNTGSAIRGLKMNALEFPLP